MNYQGFLILVQSHGFTLAELRCDVPPSDILLAFIEYVGDDYESFVLQLQKSNLISA